MDITRFFPAPGGEPKSVARADDWASRGHRTPTFGGPARVPFAHLPPDLDLGG